MLISASEIELLIFYDNLWVLFLQLYYHPNQFINNNNCYVLKSKRLFT